jgi:hypothetical protein
MEFTQDFTKARKPKKDHPWKRKIRRESLLKLNQAGTQNEENPAEKGGLVGSVEPESNR